VEIIFRFLGERMAYWEMLHYETIVARETLEEVRQLFSEPIRYGKKFIVSDFHRGT
jgi:hypothetical protein